MDDKPEIIESDGLLIVIDASYSSSDFDCSVCGLIIRGLEDVTSINNYGCCSDCEEYYYWPNKKQWKLGWRPKKEDIRRKTNN